ncbi:DUF2397 domain-containing protein [Nocardia bovistercoris]|uniref:DUF2397 domain-containing protein n=1 Tax=Nocardia bovistercoris TaxID=2785916 RepID=A0A931IB66_9NOCA|nr:DUF2397 domain-containing protein [Nocardia bovistercoris]MBH0776987.1 DUF2397 domain-containing protein [Nocardia bovistercoris]
MGDGDELVESVGVDPWAAHLPGQELVPAYLVSRFAAQYRAIVDVLVEAQDTSLTGMSFDEIATRLRAWVGERAGWQVADRLLDEDVFALDARLTSLVRWAVLTRWQEPARTGEDFLRRRDRFQLTPVAARLHAFWTVELAADEDTAADLTLAPRAIHDRLRGFAEAVREQDYPAAAAEFQQVIALHHGMAVAARSWQRSLAHALSGGPDPDKQEVLWRTLQSYVGMWGEQVDIHTPAVAGLMAEVEPRLTDSVWRACVRGALADDAPEQVVEPQVRRWTHVWESLGHWFGGSDGQARRLRRQLRDLVAPWARNMHILLDTGGALTRRGELLELAGAIEQAPDDETALAMWDTAIGVFPARHLLIAAEDADNHTVAWSDAAAAPISARYREHGQRAAVGRRVKAMNNSVGRDAARRARVAALAQRREAEAALRARSGTELADWGALSEPELRLLLDLLATARARRGEPERAGVTEDGQWRVGLTEPAIAGTTTLDCPHGRFVTRNWVFTLEPAGARRAE